ncbi:dihydrodipicolinate synthase family protein [Kineosporia sp. J2-2]|uniref:Dihydrodipicolinate synthase family protein n=1 Tax=Kineosporia corallincola TaxID=2835133 RepID=A0ABS5TI75_9ACTN|nr:dihydrodipicolinate synthase family protein [Kineosporia corallincola]MBT0770793.1 dihydrodipicolinate synthase family protein [Kineosporia corallincola]
MVADSNDTSALFSSIGGVIPPICTPLTPDRRLDLDSLRSLRAHLLRQGVSGIFALGTMGEGHYLTPSQAGTVVETLAAEKQPGEPLLVGIVEPTTPRVLEGIDRLVSDQVDGIVVTGPFYANVSEPEILRHFELIANHSPVPVLAYNMPSNTGYAITAYNIIELLAEDLIVGIKDSSLDLTNLRRVTVEVPNVDKKLIFTGSDTLLDCALDIGANGAVTGLSNIAADHFVGAMAAHAGGKRAELSAILRILNILVQVYVPTEVERGPNSTAIGALKSALVQQGIIESDTLSEPMTPVTEGRREHVRSVLEEARQLADLAETPSGLAV